jgi:uncharacterized protein (DUF924 family)
MDPVEEILQFWFDVPDRPGSDYGQQRSVWFKKDPAFDATIRQQFLSLYEQAAAGHLNHWQPQPRPCLALLLLLDQFPRNLFRGDPRSFATDAQALAIAHQAIAQGFDQTLAPVERVFVYLPLEHSENLADQDQCVALFEQLHRHHPDFASTLDFAHRHREVIQRFGRFPHRNAILGRPSTPAEAEFLQQPGSGF